MQNNLKENAVNKKKPCAPFLRIWEGLKDTNVNLFLSRENVHKLIDDVEEKFNALIDKKEGYTHLETAQIEDCIDQTVHLIKGTLKEKAFKATKIYIDEANRIIENAKEIETLDDNIKL